MVLGERLPGRVEQCGGFFYVLELDISYQLSTINYQLSTISCKAFKLEWEISSARVSN